MRRTPLFTLLALVALAMACTSPMPSSQSNMTTTTTTKTTLYYVFDALCGWCYGFSPTILRLEDKYHDKVEFEVISGGMVTGSRIGPIGQVAPYIKSAYKDVENATGIKFGNAFLDELNVGTATFSSIEPAIALAIVRDFNPQKALAFAHDLQHAIYYDGVPPTHYARIAPYAEKYGVSTERFLEQTKNPTMMQQALKEFKTSDSLKVTGFPTLFMLQNQKLVKIAEGYTSQADLEKRIETVLSHAKP